jgi:hypothetical protein
MSFKPSIKALKYSMVPPTKMGVLPRLRISKTQANASWANSAAL